MVQVGFVCRSVFVTRLDINKVHSYRAFDSNLDYKDIWAFWDWKFFRRKIPQFYNWGFWYYIELEDDL